MTTEITSAATKISGRYFQPKVDSLLIVDGHKFGERLLPGDDDTCPGWAGCEFRFPSRAVDAGLAVNITITGRTLRLIPCNDGLFIRCRVEFVGDGEPSSFAGGWLLADSCWVG